MGKRKYMFLLLVFLFIPLVVYAGRGCCSHHGGVSHCDTSTGKQVCNDGTYSPSCRCSYNPDDDEHEVKQHKITKNEENEEKDLIEKNFVPTILIGIISFWLFKKIKFKRRKIKNKILSTLYNVIAGILILSCSFIFLPLYFGIHGHFLLETLSILVIVYSLYIDVD